MRQSLAQAVQRSFLSKIAISLGLTDAALNFYWREKASWWDRVASTGIIDKPSTLWLELTMRCNLNCEMCHQYGRRKVSRKELTLDEIKSIIDQAYAMGIRLVEMTGGEVFIRKDLHEIIAYIDNKGMMQKFNTNGTMINDNDISFLKTCRHLQSIAFSIDGPPEVHNSIRGNPKAFDKVISTIKAFGKTRFLKNVVFVVMPRNIQYIEHIFNLCSSIGIDRLTFLPEMYATPDELEKTQNYLELQPEQPVYVESKESEISEEYVNAMKHGLKKIALMRIKHSMLAPVYPNIAFTNPEEFFKRKYNCRIGCKFLKSLSVAVDGSMNLCPFIHISAGNIHELTIDRLWNNEKMKTARKKILHNKNLVPVCLSCCSLTKIG